MLKIGWSRRDISTEKPVIIPGQMYMRVSKGVLDPVFVTALTMENGNDYVIFLQADVVNILDRILLKVRERVSEMNKEIDPIKILMYASHTHTGPDLDCYDNIGGLIKLSDLPHDGYEITPSSEYVDFFVQMAAEAVVESFEKRSAGAVSYGYGFATVAHSRRVVYTKEPDGQSKSFAVDGHAKMYGKTKDENFSHYEAGTESFANFVFTFDETEKLTGAIVNIPCPAQNCEAEWMLSASYWHEVREEIKKRYGDIFILPQCAAGGDLAPRQLHYLEAEQRRYRLKFSDYQGDDRLVSPSAYVEMCRRFDIALRICDSFDEVYAWASKEKYTDLSLVHRVKTVELDRRDITEEEYQHCLNEIKRLEADLTFVSTDDTKEDLRVNYMKLTASIKYRVAARRYELKKRGEPYTMEMHVIKLGNIAFASNQFELYMDYQHRIQARSPFEQTFIVQLSAQPHCRAGTYLPTERGVWGVGYSATIFCNEVSPTGGQQLVEETVKELCDIYDK